MLQGEKVTQKPPVYVTANSLVNGNCSIEVALQIAWDAGVDGFELRREQLPRTMQHDDFCLLRSKLEHFRCSPIYSTPEPLFTEEGFQGESVGQVLTEAHTFGCNMVKFAPGNIEPDNEFMLQLSSLQRSFPTMTIAVENDQSPVSRDVARWTRFFARVTELPHPIWMTFDLGNWDCVGIDAIQAAQHLGSFVIYIHTKAVERKDDICISRPIRAAHSEHAALAYLPAEVPRALEFPISGSNRDGVTSALHTYITWLRSGNFAT